MAVGLRRLMFAVLVFSAAPCVVGAGSGPARDRLASCADGSLIPTNVTLKAEYLVSLTAEMARRSPTFRAQLSAMGAAPSLRARVWSVSRLDNTAALAKTTFGYSKTGLLVADIQIPGPLVFARRDVEFIAHEVEHVIEQVEGMNLPALAAKRGSGVYRLEMTGRLFETSRAITAGQIVEREFREPPVPVMPCLPVESPLEAVD